MANLDYFYDEQIKRYLLQLIRVFSHFQVKEVSSTGTSYNRVPVRYGDASRMVSSILRNNSENVVNSAPFIALSINELQLSRERAQDPMNVDTKQVAERLYDPDTGTYSSEQGNLYTVQKYMPVPYDLTLQVDIWTTNTDTKLQLLEQIFVLFNPSLELQSNSNPLDWSNVFNITLTNTSWTSRSVPAGVDESLDIATLTFEVPIWISPPAKVKAQSIIQKIIADIHTVDSIADLGFDNDYYDFFSSIENTAQVIVTPGDYYLQISGSSAVLLNSAGIEQSWNNVIEMYGTVSTTSLLKLNTTNDPENDTDVIVGGISLSNNTMTFTLDSDTLPTNTVSSVDSIIDPRAVYPGDGLDPASAGQRYLLTEDISPAVYETVITPAVPAVPPTLGNVESSSNWTIIINDLQGPDKSSFEIAEIGWYDTSNVYLGEPGLIAANTDVLYDGNPFTTYIDSFPNDGIFAVGFFPEVEIGRVDITVAPGVDNLPTSISITFENDLKTIVELVRYDGLDFANNSYTYSFTGFNTGIADPGSPEIPETSNLELVAGQANFTLAWDILARENDIIEFDADSNSWIVSYDSSNVSTENYVTSTASSTQYKWTGSQWINSYEGTYNPGYWVLVL